MSITETAKEVSVDGWDLIVIFISGITKKIDVRGLKKYLPSNTLLADILADHSLFEKVFVEDGAPTWPNGFQLDPENIYEDGEVVHKVASSLLKKAMEKVIRDS